MAGTAAVATARCRGVPAHGHPAVRRPRKIDRGAGIGDGRREAHPAGRAAQRHRRRPGHEGCLPCGHDSQRAAALAAARRHREGTGGRQRACRDRGRHRARGLPRGQGTPAGREGNRAIRSGRPGAHLHADVRAVRESRQESSGRGAERSQRYRRAGAASRHHCRAHVAGTRAEAADPRGGLDRRAHRAPHGPDGRRDRAVPGREAHPRSRQEADGEEPARVLSE